MMYIKCSRLIVSCVFSYDFLASDSHDFRLILLRTFTTRKLHEVPFVLMLGLIGAVKFLRGPPRLSRRFKCLGSRSRLCFLRRSQVPDFLAWK